MENVFNINDANAYIDRINKLEVSTTPEWGKMDVGQMLAHCNVTYEMALTDQHAKATGFKKFILKLLVKPTVVGEKPYKKNGPTAPQFKIVSEKVFGDEQARLINYISQVQSLGEAHFDGMESNSFGKLNKQEWNTMFAKHLNHHLKQFGV